VELIGFSDQARVHKAFGEPLTPETKDRVIAELSAHIGKGDTHDADAVALALERIVKEDAERRLILVVTDGEGNGPSSLADVLPRAAQAGVTVIGVGVGAGMGYVKQAYPRHVLVETIDRLPAELKDAIAEYVTEQER